MWKERKQQRRQKNLNSEKRRETRTLLNFISVESRMIFFQTKSQPWKPRRDTTGDKSGSQAPLQQMLVLGSQCGLSYFHFVQWDRTARNQTQDQRNLIECCDPKCSLSGCLSKRTWAQYQLFPNVFKVWKLKNTLLPPTNIFP